MGVRFAHDDGVVTVVDVKAASRVDDPKVVAQFGWARAVCRRHGFGFEVWTGCDPVLLENVRFLAGYRRAVTVATELVEPVVEAAAEPVAITALERRLAKTAPPWVIRPVILYALWKSRLSADLSHGLDGATIVSVSGVRT